MTTTTSRDRIASNMEELRLHHLGEEERIGEELRVVQQKIEGLMQLVETEQRISEQLAVVRGRRMTCDEVLEQFRQPPATRQITGRGLRKEAPEDERDSREGEPGDITAQEILRKTGRPGENPRDFSKLRLDPQREPNIDEIVQRAFEKAELEVQQQQQVQQEVREKQNDRDQQKQPENEPAWAGPEWEDDSWETENQNPDGEATAETAAAEQPQAGTETQTQAGEADSPDGDSGTQESPMTTKERQKSVINSQMEIIVSTARKRNGSIRVMEAAEAIQQAGLSQQSSKTLRETVRRRLNSSPRFQRGRDGIYRLMEE